MSTRKLALDGGSPVRSTMLPYGRQWIGEDDIAAVAEVLRSDWLTTGPKVAEFEEAFAAQVQAKFAVAISNGTAALHATMFAAGISAGDEVVVPPLTFAASANCVRYEDGRVVFADVRADTLNLDPVRVEAAITPRTRAIVAVDFAGQPVELNELRRIANQHKLLLIEDAAHSLGAVYNGKPIGGQADMTTFSLHPVKHVTTGEGGVITTNDPELASRLRLFRNHGITSDHRQRQTAGSWYYEMVDLGYNYRLTDIQCALGISQLKKLGGWLERRAAIAARYTEAFSQIAELELPVVRAGCTSAWHLYVIRIRRERLSVGRAEVFHALRAENIGVNVHYIPVPWHPYYAKLGYARGNWPVAEDAYERAISLPLFPAMTDRDVQDVIEAVSKVLEAYRLRPNQTAGVAR